MPTSMRRRAALTLAALSTAALSSYAPLAGPAGAADAPASARATVTGPIFGAPIVQTSTSPWVHPEISRTDPADDATGPGAGPLELNPAEIVGLSAYPTIAEDGSAFVVAELRLRSRDLLDAASTVSLAYTFTWADNAGRSHATTFTHEARGTQSKLRAVADGRAKSCTWTSGWTRGFTGNTLTGVFPLSCLGSSTVKVSATVRANTRSQDTVWGWNPMTVDSTDLRAVTGTFDQTFTAASGTPIWRGTGTVAVAYRTAENMVHVEQRFRGRAPSFTGQLRDGVTWAFDRYSPSPVPLGTGPHGGSYAVTVRPDGDDWSVTAQRATTTGKLTTWRNWDCAMFGTAVRYDKTAGVLSLDVPVECFGGLRTLRVASNNVDSPKSGGTTFTPGSPAIRLF